MWHVDPLLGNDSETSNNTRENKHVSTAKREHSNNGRDVFYAVRGEMF
jgi:hypothetical protein